MTRKKPSPPVVSGESPRTLARKRAKYLKETTNKTFYPLYGDTHRYLVLMGGGGSGKSIFAGRKVLERCVNEPGHRCLVVRKVAKTMKESCFRQLISQAAEHYSGVEMSVNKTDMTIDIGGSSIIMTGTDNPEKLKSIYRIDMIWIEEATELTEDDFNQLDIRLRGETEHYKQIILTFNPVSVTHWLKKRFFDAVCEDTLTHRSTYRDNRFIDAAQKKVLENYKHTDEYYYNVYCLGEWGSTGKSVFNAKALYERLNKLVPPLRKGRFSYAADAGGVTRAEFVESDGGEIEIYKEPVPGRPYVIGGDTAGEGSDKFVGQVIDNISGEQVAMLRHTYDEDLYALQMYCLGRFYNDALISIETNYSTYPTRVLEKYGYPRMYVRESVDDFTHCVLQSYGFRTDARTRPVIIAGLISALRCGADVLNSRVTIEEMLSFVRNRDGRPEASAGTHDDTVMALAIAYFSREQQSFTVTKRRGSAVWTEDMREDYAAASPSEKEYLISKWGEPPSFSDN